MKDDLRKLLVSESEMYSTNGFAPVVDALHEYRNSLSRNIDNCLKFIALAGVVGLTAASAIAFSVISASYPGGMSSLGVMPGVVALGCAVALLCARVIDFEGRFILGKYGKEAHERYLQYSSPAQMQKRLYEEVTRFNRLVRAIHVSDEIDAAGVPGARIQDRDALLKSMAVARTDLMRALKLERIMREHADVSSVEFQLFNVELTQAAAMEVEDAATQQSKLMNEAFQIARSVQIEVHKLQTQDRQRSL